MDDVQGGRIRQFRMARGMTQQDLADATGGLVTKQSISKYERGKSQPSVKVLRALANAFDVKIADLARKPDAEVEFIAYRKGSKLGKRKQEQIQSIVLRKLEDRLRVQDLLGQVREINLPIRHWNVTSPKDAENAAKELRALWDLGSDPIANVTSTLEERHIYVISLDAPDKFDGISALAHDESDEHIAAAVVCQDGRPGERQRLNLAHELAHLVQRVEESDDFDEEKAAFRLGAAFLVPEQALKRDVGTRRQTIQLKELLLLKKRYGVSMQALLYRMKDLEIISAHHYKQWFIQISKQGWRTSEPEELPRETADWFRRSVLRAYSEELLPKKEAERMLNERIETKTEDEALMRRREFMKLSPDERGKILRKQAEDMASYYEEHEEETDEFQGGDIVEYE
ncbi:helix-turn-helix domain-containing protein [Longibacter sp.]|uniref:helix-turn-helix domain-containing protein n=1 Tax=Longibacter sp. TaxID=2045415 RepID=UPI003EBFDB32